MPEPIEKKEEGVEEESIDAFGQDLNTPSNPEEGEEGKKEDKKYETIPEDHPTIVTLKNEIEKVKQDKDSMGGNLSKQNDIIKILEGKIDVLMQGKGGDKGKETEFDVIYKPEDIKRSKDLTEEEREEMTSTEIRQMDEIADMKEKQNEIYANQQKEARERKAKEDAGTGTKVEDINKAVQEHAKTLAKGEDGKDNTEMANQIIESFKVLKFDVEGLSAEELQKRVEMAASQVPNYTPPKEQVNKGGKGVDGGKGKTDVFNTDQIIEEATKDNDGNYSL